MKSLYGKQNFQFLCTEYGGTYFPKGVLMPEECHFYAPSKAIRLIKRLIELGVTSDHPVVVVADETLSIPKGVGKRKLLAEIGKDGIDISVETEIPVSTELEVADVLRSLGLSDSEVERELVDLERRFINEKGEEVVKDLPPELQKLTSCKGDINESGEFVVSCVSKIPENQLSKKLVYHAWDEQESSIFYSTYRLPMLLEKLK